MPLSWPQNPLTPFSLSPSILPTAFLGTASIFACFSLSALYARRRSYLYLGGERGFGEDSRRAGGSLRVLGSSPDLALTPCPRPAGFLLSGLTLMLLSSVINAFVRSTWLFTVSPLPPAEDGQTDR